MLLPSHKSHTSSIVRCVFYLVISSVVDAETKPLIGPRRTFVPPHTAREKETVPLVVECHCCVVLPWDYKKIEPLLHFPHLLLHFPLAFHLLSLLQCLRLPGLFHKIPFPPKNQKSKEVYEHYTYRRSTGVRSIGRAIAVAEAVLTFAKGEQDVSPVRQPLQQFHVDLHLLHDFVALLALSDLHELLHNVIPVLILHHRHDRRVLRVADLTLLVDGHLLPQRDFDEEFPVRLVGLLDAFLHDVRGVLVAAHRGHVVVHDLKDQMPVRLPAVLDHVLDDVVSVAVVDENAQVVLMDLIVDLGHLLRVAVLDNPLQHTRTVAVRRHAPNLAAETVDDELHLPRWHSLEKLLQDVVSVLVLDGLQDTAVQILSELQLQVHIQTLHDPL
mmetsp:Transcript_11207/g.27397  ORF Transcript_11207/g.27397 Transcript_11207/m.27397 type:complete len:385 (+) Transcript_11207:2759-3913(+)